MWLDNEAERDFINFTSVADTVAEIIIQAKSRPISIGVSGSWGSGKSSMIKLIHQSMEQRKETGGPEFLFVEFNAWLYQGYDDARAALMEVIASALEKKAEEKKTGVDKVRELLKRVNWFRVAKLTVSSAAAIALGLPPIGLIGEVIETGKKLASGNAEEDDVRKIDGMVIETGSTAAGLIKPKSESSPPKEIHLIRKCFEDALSEMGITLVVLIDDLDRCLPPTTISTLEAIRLFLFLKNTAFVIAADNDMIKHAVKKHFGDVDDKQVVSYFDKLIQVPIRVPPLGTQEVRAYMMMLFVENSSLEEPAKEDIRVKLCKQLAQTWQGKRVDIAFIKSLNHNLSAELVAQLDTAERLAPIMTTASQIAGNPRLIKRFLNALSIRMAISRSHGVGVDEKILAKMLLFERCGSQKAYAELAKAVNEDTYGKPKILADLELRACAGEKLDLKDPWDDDFVREWLALPPSLANIDLRGVLYVSREHVPLITPEDRLSSEALELLSALLENPDMAGGLTEKLSKIQRIELSIIMDKLLDRARQEQEWGAPPILDACLTVCGIDSSHGSRLSGFLAERPPAQIKANIVPKISDQPWAMDVFGIWEKSGVSTPVKTAITRLKRK